MIKIISLVVVLFSGVCQAGILELRLGLGPSSVDPKAYNSNAETLSSNLRVKEFFGIHLDGILKLPLVPLGFGVRLENGNSEKKADLGGNLYLARELSVDRVALLANWRLINTLVFVGPIATLGTHSGEIESTLHVAQVPFVTTTKLKGDGPSFSLGAEGGVKLKRFVGGLETGYQFMKLKSETAGDPKIDLSGVYVRLLLGLSLF